jgi:hypothetical protein
VIRSIGETLLAVIFLRGIDVPTVIAECDSSSI